MIQMKLVLLSLTSTGGGQFLLAAVEAHDSLWLAIVSILMGILTIGLGVMVATFVKHIERHPGVTVNECVIKHAGLDKEIKLNTRYLETLIEHNGLQNKVKPAEDENP